MADGGDGPARRISRHAACSFRRDVTPWDRLTHIYHNPAAVDTIPAGNAGTVVLAWPPLFAALHLVHPELDGKTALDFGCGAGQLCRRLHELGCRVTGVDASGAMLNLARESLPPEVVLSACLPTEGKFEIITSVQCLPFMASLGDTLRSFDRLLARDGVAVFVVPNPPFVLNLARANRIYSGFTAAAPLPQQGSMAIQADTPLPLYLRSADDYRTRCTALGWQEMLTALPPFTARFLERYPQPYPTDIPEFLVLAFRKP